MGTERRLEGAGAGPHRLKPLDGLRGIAILLVMGAHLARGGHHNPMLNLLIKVASAGWVGVDLFFVLSGFLITRILISARQSPRYFRDFYMRRFLRIFPLYYGVLMVTLLVLPRLKPAASAPSDPSSAWLWLYISNIYPLIRSTWFELPNSFGLKFGHFWSLCVEEQFYLIWPFIVLKLQSGKLMKLCLALIALCLGIRVALVASHVSQSAIYCFTLCRMDALLIGAALAVLSVNRPPSPRWQHQARLTIAVCLPPVIASMLVARGTGWSTPFLQTIGYSLIGLSCGALVVLSVYSPPRASGRRVLESPFLTFFGKYSYGLYVFHALIWRHVEEGVLSVDSFRRYTHSYLVAFAVHIAVAFGVSVGIAYASWNLYEKHFLRLKRHFAYGASPAPVWVRAQDT